MTNAFLHWVQLVNRGGGQPIQPIMASKSTSSLSLRPFNSALLVSCYMYIHARAARPRFLPPQPLLPSRPFFPPTPTSNMSIISRAPLSSLRSLRPPHAPNVLNLSTKTPTHPRPRARPLPHSRSHFETRVVPFTPQQVYSVVANVNDYSNFVPWCTASAVTHTLDSRTIIADLSVGFRFLSDHYTSVISLDPYNAVSVDVPHSSLFEYLITDWKFANVTNHGTELSFYLEFAFRNRLYQRVTDLFFEDVVKQMVGAFERQCHEKYRLHNGILHRW